MLLFGEITLLLINEELRTQRVSMASELLLFTNIAPPRKPAMFSLKVQFSKIAEAFLKAIAPPLLTLLLLPTASFPMKVQFLNFGCILLPWS